MMQPGILGLWNNSDLEIFMGNSETDLVVKWLTNQRPTASGKILSPTTGYLEFPDDRRYNYELDAGIEIQTLFFDGRNSGNTWTKKTTQQPMMQQQPMQGTYACGMCRKERKRG